MATQEIFKTLQRIQIQTTHLANDLLSGAYKSAFKGKGMEFEENREYQPGDDVRAIDWNVTARMQHPYIKVFREEREISVILLIDVSASSRFGSTEKLKSELIAEIGGVIAFSAIQNHDKIGLILFSDKIEKYIPPQKGSRHVLRLIREILLFEPESKKTDISIALKFLGNLSIKAGVCFLISDFISSDYAHEAALIAQKYDLISMHIIDPLEMHFPSQGLMKRLTRKFMGGLITLQDLETGEIAIIDASDKATLENFERRAKNRIATQEKLMNKIGAGFISIPTDQPYIPIIKKYFKTRGMQRK